MSHHSKTHNQITSLDEAVNFAVMARLAGIGIEPIDDTNGYHNDNSGLYLQPWGGSDPGQPEPGAGTNRQFLLRLTQKNNAGSHLEGFNVGLLIAIAIGHPKLEGGPPDYSRAIEALKSDAADQLVNANQGGD